MKPEGFEFKGSRGIYRPVGVTVSFEAVVALVRAAIAAACANKAKDILVDLTALTGFAAPDTVDRFLAVVDWANEADASLRLAIVAPADMIDPQKFGVAVAANRGLVANIFSSVPEASAWLDANRRPD